MEYKLFIEKAVEQYRKKIPFVAYSIADSNAVNAYFQKDDRLHSLEDLSKKGFVLGPFDSSGPSFYIPEEESEFGSASVLAEELDSILVKPPNSPAEKANYLKLVEKTLDAIKSRKASKIVISRCRDIPLKEFNIEILLKQLFSANPAVFRYIWFHPQTGIWCGATPEILVRTEGSSFTTMALAGTQKFTDRIPVIWSPKEIDEQQLVTDYITNNLQRVTSVLKVSNTHTHKAGSLLHLRTNITGVLKNGKTTLTTIVGALHPTPAVCGSPQKFAMDFILKNEGYPREFYTGFLGPITGGQSSSLLMVNLRCMKIEENTARIYVGGGITIGSHPKEEWRETKNKMQTMLQVLRPML